MCYQAPCFLHFVCLAYPLNLTVEAVHSSRHHYLLVDYAASHPSGCLFNVCFVSKCNKVGSFMKGCVIGYTNASDVIWLLKDNRGRNG
jgi:hypothetical protein